MAIEKEKIAELKELLLKEKKDLETSLGKIATPINPEEGDYETSFEDIGTDKDDSATEVEQYTQNLSVETALEKKLQDVLDALERIEKGTYGICENCQKEIPLKRLLVNPSARVCVSCS